jgi:hypothetical protein
LEGGARVIEGHWRRRDVIGGGESLLEAVRVC